MRQNITSFWFVFLLLFFIFFIIQTNAEEYGYGENTCNISLSLSLNQTTYANNETIKFRPVLSNKSFDFVIEYWIEDIFGNITKKRATTSNTDLKSYTPKIKTSTAVLVIKANLTYINCNDADKSDNYFEKMVVVINYDFNEGEAEDEQKQEEEKQDKDQNASGQKQADPLPKTSFIEFYDEDGEDSENLTVAPKNAQDDSNDAGNSPEEISGAAVSNASSLAYESKTEKTKNVAYVLIALALIVHLIITIIDKFKNRNTKNRNNENKTFSSPGFLNPFKNRNLLKQEINTKAQDGRERDAVQGDSGNSWQPERACRGDPEKLCQEIKRR